MCSGVPLIVRPRFVASLILVAAVAFGVPAAKTAHAGDVEKWHRIELVFTDPAAIYAEADETPNPFLDRRLTCTFTSPGCAESYTVQGFFNADNVGGTAGNKFVCRFSPSEVGTWEYTASFREGPDVALSLEESAGVERALVESKAGSFTVDASSRARPDFRHNGLGWLRNAGGHLFQHAGSTTRVLKIGLNLGEGFLGYAGFDNTERACTPSASKPSEVKDYASHRGDWRPGDPNWRCADGCLHSNPNNAGKEIIGAVNYIAGFGVNAKYVLLLNVPDGDTCDVYPYLDSSMSEESKRHFDTSKLAQWEHVFEHMTARGVMIHAQLGEVEIGTALDSDARTCSGPVGGCLGPHRRLYYREMVARFAHNPAVLWNIGEENGYSDDARRDFIDYLHAINPYDQPVTSHTTNKDGGGDPDIENHYAPLLGNADFDATSIQMSPTDGEWSGIRNEVLRWRGESRAAGEPWIVAIDEVPRGADYNDDFELSRARKRHQWQTLMAGGHYEWYLTLDNSIAPHSGWNEHGLDPWLNDFRLVEDVLRWTAVARVIFARIPSLQKLVPVATGTVVDSTGSPDTWTLADAGTAYLAYDREGGEFTFDGAAGSYSVTFFNPDTGAACPGTPASVVGGAPTDLGACSCCSEDAAVLLLREAGAAAGADADAPCPGACGDATLDDFTSATDALVVLQAAVGQGNCASCVCDVNASGAVTVTDALAILRFSVGSLCRIVCPGQAAQSVD